MKISKPARKILLILFVMACSYMTLLAIIHYSKLLAETNSEATQFAPPLIPTPNN